MLLFNRYQYDPKKDLIGKGGFSRVYKAHDNKLNRRVALKVYKTNHLAEKYSPIAEIQRVINLEHPNICRYIDIEEFEKEDAFGDTETLQVCVLELLDGGNLSQYYNENKDLAVFKKLIIDVLNGLSYLHRNGVIHRDIKPANMLIKVTIDGPVAKITDFGISTRSDSEGNNTSSALIVSIPYMAPEQLNAQKYGIDEKISYNVDFWSLGVTVFEIICGTALFKNSLGESSEQIMTNIMMPDLPERINQVPEPFRTFVAKCVVKDAKQRVKNAEELVSILRSVSITHNSIESSEVIATTDSLRNDSSESELPIVLSVPQETLPVTDSIEESEPVELVTENFQPPVVSDSTLPPTESIHEKKFDITTDRSLVYMSKPKTPAVASDLKNIEPTVEPLMNEPEDVSTMSAEPEDNTVVLPFKKIQAASEANPEVDKTESVGKASTGSPANNEQTQKAEETQSENVDDTQILPLSKLKQSVKDLEEDERVKDEIETQAIQIESKKSSVEREEPPNEDDTQVFHHIKKPSQIESATREKDEENVDVTQILQSLEKQAAEKKPVLENPVNLDETQVMQKERVALNDPQPAVSDIAAKTENVIEPGIERKEKPVTLFNRYDYNPMKDLIGKGGFSKVYKAFDRKLSRWVALKIYKTGEFADNYSPIAEIKRVVNLDHANICRYLDIEEIEKENPFGENEKTQICVMELLDSGNFTEYFRKNKDLEVLRKLLQDVLHGLAYLHKKGIIHRDIKPANILVKENVEGPVAKITDFGISKSSETISNHSSSSLIVSIPYMAPEQLNVKKYGIQERISYNLDLWSLGVTIFEVITGKVLFKNSDQDSSEQIMTNIMAPELPTKIDELPEPFRSVVAKCIVKNASERAQRAEDLIRILNAPISQPTIAIPIPEVNRDIEPTPEIKKAKSAFFLSEEDQPVAKTKKIIKPVAYSEPESTKKKSKIRFSPILTKKVSDSFNRHKRVIMIGCLLLIPLAVLFALLVSKGSRNPTEISKYPESLTKPSSIVPAKSASVSPLPSTDTVTKNTGPNLDSVTRKPVIAPTAKVQPEKAKSNTTLPPAIPSSETRRDLKYVLRLSANEACTIKINQLDNGRTWDFQLQPGKISSIRLNPGKYFLQAVNLRDNSKYGANLQITNENMGESGRHNIQFK